MTEMIILKLLKIIFVLNHIEFEINIHYNIKLECIYLLQKKIANNFKIYFNNNNSNNEHKATSIASFEDTLESLTGFRIDLKSSILERNMTSAVFFCRQPVKGGIWNSEVITRKERNFYTQPQYQSAHYIIFGNEVYKENEAFFNSKPTRKNDLSMNEATLPITYITNDSSSPPKYKKFEKFISMTMSIFLKLLLANSILRLAAKSSSSGNMVFEVYIFFNILILNAITFFERNYLATENMLFLSFNILLGILNLVVKRDLNIKIKIIILVYIVYLVNKIFI